MLMRLELRLGRIMALMGRETPFAGEPGGEVAICAATAAPLDGEGWCAARCGGIVEFVCFWVEVGCTGGG